MPDPMTAIAGTSLAYGIYANESAPGAPNIPDAPPPASYYSYDEFGNLATEQVWDAEKNAYITRQDPEPKAPELPVASDLVSPEALGIEPKPTFPYFSNPKGGNAAWQREKERRKAIMDPWTAKYEQAKADYYKTHDVDPEKNPEYVEAYAKYEKDLATWEERKGARLEDKRVRDELRGKMLGNLNQTPEDRIKAYQEYADTFSDVMHRDVDKRYDKVVRSEEERMNARGMTGSRAYVDTLGARREEKLQADVDIANSATLAKETLGQMDRSYWLNTLNSLDSGARADATLSMNKAQVANQGAIQGTAAIMGQYGANSLNAMNKWEAQLSQHQAGVNSITNTATGLAFLYGFGGGGSTTGGQTNTSILKPSYRTTRYS